MAAAEESADILTRLGFIALAPTINPNILLFTPPRSASAHSSPRPQESKEPKVIILATWLGGATASRIAVYCRAYQSLYRSATILLIRTTLTDITTKTFSAVQEGLVPAAKYLLEMFPLGGSRLSSSSEDHHAGVQQAALLHVFSHGGCNTALQLSRLIRRKALGDIVSAGGDEALVDFPVPLMGVILDSCPGSSSFGKAYRAAAYSLPPSQPVNLLGRACLVPLIGSMSILQSWGVFRSVEDLRRELNHPRTFGGNTPRLYLHSKGDRFVGAEDVASHADELAATGVRVVRHVWDVAEHCALPMEDARKYWDAVREFVSEYAVARIAPRL